MKKEKQVFVIVNDIRSNFNVGSIFRTSDALGVSKIFLSEQSAKPLDKFQREVKEVSKVALGAEKNISWEVFKSIVSLIKKLKSQGVQVIAIEQGEGAVDYKKVKVNCPVAFIVGHEVDGIPKKILKLCDIVAEIPMAGKKESLNVSVAFGVSMFRMLQK